MERKKSILGWIGVSITLIISSIWAYWGAFENFHEGWYSTSVWENLFIFFFQYMLFSILFILLALVILRWKKIGLILHLLLGGFCVWFFSGSAFSVIGLLIVVPFAGLGLIYYFGDPKPRKWACRLIVFIPLIITIAISIPQGIKVANRMNDQDFGIRVVEGNEVTLAWAPRGPGWPDRGVSWKEAQDICRYLSADGLTVMETEQNIWRLPTVDEAVRSCMYHGENCGGIWNAMTGEAIYEKTPDKETPLWDVHSKVIYYWMADTSPVNEEKAYIIVYHGGVYAKMKTDQPDYLSFRAVKETGTSE